MSVLRALVVVGLVGCSHPAPRPTHVDSARTNINSAYAALLETNAGSVVTRPAYADALAPTCRTAADCGGGALSCRAREDGVRVCMGVGSPGDACWFNSDCVSGTCSLDDDGERTCR